MINRNRKNSPINAESFLNYIKELSAAKSGRVISGVHTPEGSQELYEQTGHWPGILGTEYCYTYGTQPTGSPEQAVPWRELNPPLIEHGLAGGVVRILSHFPNPSRTDFCGLRDTDADFSRILADGTPERERWLSLLDQVAAGFHDLADYGVTVIYGPLHEMNCPGFWWGLDHPQNSPELYKALWRDMTARIRDHHQCSNVLWLWAPLAMCEVNLDAYPGEDVVDLVGLDVYDPSLQPFIDSYQAVNSIGKPFVLSEFGPGKWDMTEPADPPYDCRQLLEDIKEYWPDTISFMFWGGCFLPTRQRYAPEMMAAANVIDRDHLMR